MSKQMTESTQEFCYFSQDMFPNASQNIVAMKADGGNHFMEFGIVEGSIVYLDLAAKSKKGCLSCYKRTYTKDGPLYKLSLHPMEGYRYFGRVILTMKYYEV